MKSQNKWLITVIIVSLVKQITALKPKENHKPVHKDQALPLARSFGISGPNHMSSEEHHLSQEFIEHYQKMLKDQESLESCGDRDTKRLRRLIGDDDFGLMAEAGKSYPRRRNAPKFEAPALNRRARSQAVRRSKLNSQALRSHVQHSKHYKDYSDYNLFS